VIGLAIIGFIIWIGFYLSPQSVIGTADAIVVISGGETAQRVQEGVNLFKEKFAPLIIMSGAAKDSGISNAQAMEQLAIADGVPEANILIEENAQDTIGNAKFVRDLIDQHQIKSIILVTSPYHQRRAYITFREYLGPDFVIYNHSATDSAWRKNGWWKDSWARKLTWEEFKKIFYINLFFKLST
jgi:uncharacterized SAM-binding protein YcdF (DUF218 family)